MTKRCQECVDLHPGAPCLKHAVPRPAPETIKMYCDHGLVPPGGCKACYDENPRNWNPPMFQGVIKPITEVMKQPLRQPFIGDSLDKINWDLENKK